MRLAFPLPVHTLGEVISPQPRSSDREWLTLECNAVILATSFRGSRRKNLHAEQQLLERYCGTYRGSYMSWLGPIQSQRIQKQIPRLDGLLLTGMWVGAPGGLPVVLKTGREILCRKVGIPFQGQ